MDRVVLNTLFRITAMQMSPVEIPEVIPQLTYEQFLDFHRTYYHPSNSYIYLYGDMDMEEKLRWLDEEYLCHYDKKDVNSEIHLQKPFDEVQEKTFEYSIASDESTEENTFLSYNKVIGTTLDRELYQAFEILDYALLSAPGAPLKKALTDAGIGKDIMGSYDNGVYQPIFSVVAKNAEESQKDEFVKVIEDVLRDQVKNGINRKRFWQESTTTNSDTEKLIFGNYPKGLMYGLQVMDSWLYDETSRLSILRR